MVECPQCGHALMNARNRYLYPLTWLWHKLPTSELRSCWLWSWRSWGGTQSSLWWPARLSTSASRIHRRWTREILASDWSRKITWPKYWPLIGRDHVTTILASDWLTSTSSQPDINTSDAAVQFILGYGYLISDLTRIKTQAYLVCAHELDFGDDHFSSSLGCCVDGELNCQNKMFRWLRDLFSQSQQIWATEPGWWYQARVRKFPRKQRYEDMIMCRAQGWGWEGRVEEG